MLDTSAQIAYAAYRAATGGLTHDGRPMPAWDQLGPTIQHAWSCAAQAVLDAAEPAQAPAKPLPTRRERRALERATRRPPGATVPDQTPALEPIVQATRYTVNCVSPESSPDAHVFELIVEYRGKDTWAVTRHHRSLGRDGTWSYGPEWPADSPGSREPATDDEHEDYESARQEWLGEHRFDLDEAIELAKNAAPLVTVNGLTPAAALARIARIRTTSSPS